MSDSKTIRVLSSYLIFSETKELLLSALSDKERSAVNTAVSEHISQAIAFQLSAKPKRDTAEAISPDFKTDKTAL